jgi:hypothetical protein
VIALFALIVVCGVIVLEVSVTYRSRAEVIEPRDEAEDWRTVAENLGAIVDNQPYVLDSYADVGFDEGRVARVMAQLGACREAYPR